LRWIFGPTQDEKWWRIRYNVEIDGLYKDVKSQNTAVRRACNHNGGASCTKESPATNNLLQETDRKTQETMGRWSEKEFRHVILNTSLENRSQKQIILEVTHTRGQGSIWAVTSFQQ
jgi:hypothetical protein